MQIFDATITLVITSLLSGCSQAHDSARGSIRGSGRGDDNKNNIRNRSRGVFDFYVLSMSYQPEFCFQHRHEGFPGCENPIDFWKSNLTLHGLWPEGNDGSWPSTCTNEKFNPQTVSEIGETKFEKMWPNVKAPKSPTSYTFYSFWEHEWTKHGTCSGLNQVAYFNTTLNHFLATPSLVGENYGGSVTKEQLVSAYGGNVVLACSGGRYLSEVRTCIGKSLDGTATERIECIPEVLMEGNCGDLIHIPKFYIDDDDDDNDGDESDKRGGEESARSVDFTKDFLEVSATS